MPPLYKLLIILISLIIFFSCNTKQQNKKTENTTTQDTLAPLQVTALADLPDSLQPKTFILNNMPAPKVIIAGAGQINMLPILQNAKGEPILDSDGKPFIMGDGGKSNFTNFTSDNGLALDGINCSVMDKSGNLWFGTFGGGVSKYNGKTFTTFTTAQGLVDNLVNSIIEDKSGNLWFGTDEAGVSKYDGKTFTNFTTAQGLANNVVLSITEDKSGNLWFGTFSGGVSKYDGKSFSSFTTAQGLANNVVWSIKEDKSGNLWFGTYGGVSKYDGKSFSSFTTAQGLTNNIVLTITEDKSGNLWFGTQGGGVSKYDGKTLPPGQVSFTNYTTAQGLAGNTVYSITEDKSGNLWFGTYGGGVSKYDGKTFASYTTAQGLANNIVRSITEDKSGNLWFGTYGRGVSKYDGKTFSSFTTDQGLADDYVFSIAEDQSGNLWFGTDGGGVSIYDGKTFSSFTTVKGLANNTVQGMANNNIISITEDKSGNLWFGTNGSGVSKYDGNRVEAIQRGEKVPLGDQQDLKKDKNGLLIKTFTSYTTTQGLANNDIRCITEDQSGNLWFGTNGGGVSKYDGKTLPAGQASFTNFTMAQGLAGDVVYSITEDKSGNLWFGTGGDGVSKYDGKTFSNYTTAQGLAGNTVYGITEDQSGNLWFGTSEGLSVLSGRVGKDLSKKANNSDSNRDKDYKAEKLFKSFKIADGLPDNFVTQVIQIPNGKMAVGTNLGITLFNISEDYTKLKDIEIFNSNTGHPVKDVNVGQNCMYIDSKGVIWAGTGSEKTALVRFDYAALPKNTTPPVLLIESIKVKDENICWLNLQSKGLRKNAEDSAAALLQEYMAYGKILSASENDSILRHFGNIAFDGITKFYPLPENLVLPYEHNQISFEFVAIETGRPFLVKYQYMLEGYDENWSPVTEKSNANFGNMNEGSYTFKLTAQGANGVWSEPISYTFKVLPPWYRTWWAYLIYALVFLLALRIFSFWRERNLRAEKEKLEKTVEERTEELVYKNTVIEKEKKEADKQRDEADKQRKRSDDLLLNILPQEVAEELKAKGSADAKQFDEVTVLFTDFKDFTQISEKMTPKELVEEIHTCFKAFDHIVEKHGIEKIKTIGDSYMCAGGLPVASKTHAEDIVRAGLAIQKFILNRMAERAAAGKAPFQIRMGIHTGPVVAGIVGIRKFAYDIWGDTVNTASRMESSGEVGKVNISGPTYELVKDKFTCIHRGKIQAKGKGEIDMYFVEGMI